jgi:hypothetical protein
MFNNFNNDAESIRVLSERLKLYSVMLGRAENPLKRKSLLDTIEGIVADISAYCGDVRSDIEIAS